MVVHSVLPPKLGAEVDSVLAAAGVGHVAHGADDAVGAGVAAAGDRAAVALIGPVRSREVAQTVEATAPAGLPLLAPLATWAGVTRDDEPGCEDNPADHRGTVFRLVARDTDEAERIAADVRSTNRRAFVVAGKHEYGAQLDGQLRLARLPRTVQTEDADLVVLCGLVDEPEVEQVRSLAPLPVIAFDGIQGADLGDREAVHLALPFSPSSDIPPLELFAGKRQARHAAELVTQTLEEGARDRATLLAGLRERGIFDAHGDPTRPEIWLWRATSHWELHPDRPLTAPR